jgi:hypothetical protein
MTRLATLLVALSISAGGFPQIRAAEPSAKNQLTLTFFEMQDVGGCGLAIAMKTPGGRTWLYDTGVAGGQGHVLRCRGAAVSANAFRCGFPLKGHQQISLVGCAALPMLTARPAQGNARGPRDCDQDALRCGAALTRRRPTAPAYS